MELSDCMKYRKIKYISLYILCNCFIKCLITYCGLFEIYILVLADAVFGHKCILQYFHFFGTYTVHNPGLYLALVNDVIHVKNVWPHIC